MNRWILLLIVIVVAIIFIINSFNKSIVLMSSNFYPRIWTWKQKQTIRLYKFFYIMEYTHKYIAQQKHIFTR